MTARDGWATCPVTELGFVRVSSNPAVIGDAVRPQDAAAVLQRLTSLPGHRFWPDDLALPVLIAERDQRTQWVEVIGSETGTPAG